ncbi:hypothetical protein DAEQUDRAFT_732502 [Daedalea quercina L-15889]|uniref:Uncharacterized protein n=1 Tax=Daedalea quercina L-15889 TaxID=1314783 RepID=A0A165LL51_9APHY|nr:hypothetical protein DAEQUDRAFT_732502 [Daedalea quercina L-15889]
MASELSSVTKPPIQLEQLSFNNSDVVILFGLGFFCNLRTQTKSSMISYKRDVK